MSGAGLSEMCGAEPDVGTSHNARYR